MNSPVLYIFSGLPGTGKSTLAQLLAAKLGCAYLRIDTIEQALRDSCRISVETEGYELAYRIAADNLKIGISVVSDSCNALGVARVEWEACARNSGAIFKNIELHCSNTDEHRNRIETRVSSVPGLRLPTWLEVTQRDYEAWTRYRVVIDTSGKSPEQSLEELVNALSNYQETNAEQGSGGQPDNTPS